MSFQLKKVLYDLVGKCTMHSEVQRRSGVSGSRAGNDNGCQGENLRAKARVMEKHDPSKTCKYCSRAGR